MAKIRRFKKGIEEIMNEIMSSREKPYIASINGRPNSGKTELRKILIENTHNKNKKIWSGMGESRYPIYNSDTDCCFIEDIDYWPSAWMFSKEYFGKEADIRVYLVISRNEITKTKHKEYDMIIINPEAKIKRL